MRATVGGVLDYRLLAQLHRPTDEASMSREARKLAAQGLKTTLSEDRQERLHQAILEKARKAEAA